MIYRIMDAVGQAIIGTVYRTRGSEEQVAYPLRTAALQHVQKAHDIAVHIAMRRFQGISHPRLGSQIDDNVKVRTRKKCLHCLAIGQIQRLKLKSGMPLQLRQAIPFQAGIIVVIEIVYAADNPAISQ